MKKVALSLLALALVGAGAFAQEAPALKIGGYLDIGTLTTINPDTSNSTVIKGDDSGIGGGSYVFKLSYGTDKAGLVTKTRLEDLTGKYAVSANTATSTTATGLLPNPQAFYAWFLVPNAEALKVQVGNYDDDGTAWNMVDDKGDKQTKATGIALQATPSEGFSIGGGMAANGAKNPGYSVGAVYSVPGTVKVAGALLTGNDKSYAIAVSNVAASFKLLLDGPLSASGGINLYGLEKDSAGKATGLAGIYDVLVGYAITDAFSASLNTYVYTYGADQKAGTDDASVSYKLTPGVMYTVDPITAVGAEMTYQQGNADAKNTAGTAIDPKNKLTTITVKPKVNFTIDPNTKILVYYAYTTKSGDDKPKTDATSSAISIEARYSF